MTSTDDEVIIEAKNVTRRYLARAGVRTEVVALDGVSVAVRQGETVGVVGESGSGKTTLSRLLLGLERPTAGQINFRGEDLSDLDRGSRRRYRRQVAAVFQNPFSSLDPRMRIWQIITEQLVIERQGSAAGRKARATDLLNRVGLDESYSLRYPHQLSGGQRQRVAIARALVSDPDLIVLDEAISALDVSIRAQIVNLLIDLQESLGITYVFIAHDLAIVRHLCDRIVVLYRGRVVEEGDAESVFSNPDHPYTAALIEASYLGEATLDVAPSDVTRPEMSAPNHVQQEAASPPAGMSNATSSSTASTQAEE